MINWKKITDKKRKKVACDNKGENQNRIPHEYAVGDTVLKIRRGVKRKYFKSKTPYEITALHTNNTVTIQQGTKCQNIYWKYRTL